MQLNSGKGYKKVNPWPHKKGTFFSSKNIDTQNLARYHPPRNYSSLVQSVERRTVNPYVAGSSPAGGAKFKKKDVLGRLFLFHFWVSTADQLLAFPI